MSCEFDPGLRAHIISHAVRAVEKTPMQSNPFPHFSTQGFLPEDVYRDLLNQFPPMDLYEVFGYRHHQYNGSSNRRRFALNNASLDGLTGQSRTLWYSLRSALGSPELKTTVFSKLAYGLAHRYGVTEEKAVDLPGFAHPELFHETTGYQIKPHPDTRRKVVTMQIALPADDTQEDLGTEFYRLSMNPAHWTRQPRGFEMVRRMPFLPNTVYAFAVLNTVRLRSWHGRTEVREDAGPRNSILNIWYENAEDANLDLVRENEQLPQAASAQGNRPVAA